VSDFPECLVPRHEYEDKDGRLIGQNGQRCHRIEFHGGNCIFDRPPEFEPDREPTNFRTNSSLSKLTRSTVITPRLVPNPAAEA
jgi:hypothetical protein